VAGAGVVAVLHELDQREPEQLLVEPDRLLDVPADQREVVHPLHGRCGALGGVGEVALLQLHPSGTDRLELGSLWLRHRTSFL
jgi:hypothetical protein